MPANFPEVWVKRVRTRLNEGAIAPWLDGIAEIDAPVIEINEGDMSETNQIHVPASSFKPDVLINNNTYPLALQSYTDTTLTINLDKYQTLVTTLTDDQVIGAAYPQIDNATRSHVEAIAEKKFSKAIHAMSPASHDATKTPVLVTTGDLVNGRRRMTYADLVAFRASCDAAGMSKLGRRFVPCSDHYNDMLLDRQNFGDKLVNYAEGQLAPKIAGFEIYPDFIANPYYTVATKAKLAFGAVPGAGTSQASVAFAVSGIAKKTGKTKQYFDKPTARNQQNEIAYRHYFIALPYEVKDIAAIVSALS